MGAGAGGPIRARPAGGAGAVSALLGAPFGIWAALIGDVVLTGLAWVLILQDRR